MQVIIWWWWYSASGENRVQEGRLGKGDACVNWATVQVKSWIRTVFSLEGIKVSSKHSRTFRYIPWHVCIQCVCSCKCLTLLGCQFQKSIYLSLLGGIKHLMKLGTIWHCAVNWGDNCKSGTFRATQVDYYYQQQLLLYIWVLESGLQLSQSNGFVCS